jgi:hypothetical protein
MTELKPWQYRHPAAAWRDLLMGQAVQDQAGRHLGIVEAVSTSSGGRLRRIGVRASRRDKSLHFLSAEGAEFCADHIVVPVEAPRTNYLVLPVETLRPGRFRLFFDRRRRSLLRTR